MLLINRNKRNRTIELKRKLISHEYPKVNNNCRTVVSHVSQPQKFHRWIDIKENKGIGGKQYVSLIVIH